MFKEGTDQQDGPNTPWDTSTEVDVFRGWMGGVTFAMILRDKSHQKSIHSLTRQRCLKSFPSNDSNDKVLPFCTCFPC